MKRFFAVLLLLTGFSALLVAHAEASGTSCSAPVFSEKSIPLWQFVGLAVLFAIGAVGVGFGFSMKKMPFVAIGTVLILASAAAYLSGSGFNFTTGFFDKNQHIHADIQAYVYGTAVNFSQPRFQGTDEQELSGFVHFHDGNGRVIHLHASGVPMSYLFGTFGGVLNRTCIQVAAEAPVYCGNGTDSLKFFVNGKSIPDLSTYQFQDLDRLLISFGPQNENVSGQLSSVTNESCIPSGKCPAPLGYVMPPESCSS